MDDCAVDVLVVEDEPNLLRSISASLIQEGLNVLSANTLSMATAAAEQRPALIVLDRMLPDGEGIEWLRAQRRMGNNSYVLVLTARDAVEDRIDGLDSGADDYLVKPFALEEFLARVHALRRRENRAVVTQLQVGDIRADLVSRVVFRGDQQIELPQRQFELLVCLMRQAPKVVPRQMIAEEVWKEESATWTNVIEVQVNLLRKKLHIEGTERILQTVRGVGYKLEVSK
jgi:DNA-binding response OmpR family regulator